MLRIPTSRIAVVLLTTVCLVTLTLTTASPVRADDNADLMATAKKVMAAWQSMDPAKAAAFYDKNPHDIFFDMAPVKYEGWMAYASGSIEMFKEVKSLTLAMNDDFWMQQEGTMAVTAATGHATMVGKDDHTMSHDWRWTAVWKKSGANWLIVHEHFSAPIEMPSATEKPMGE